MVRFGQIVVDELEHRGLELNPANERIVREDLRRKEGMDVCARRSLPKLQNLLRGHETVVIDGLYSWSEYRTLREQLGPQLIVILVFTPRWLRYERLQKRKVRPLTIHEAELRDFQEIENLEKGGPIAVADYVIINDDTEEKLRIAADELLAKLRCTTHISSISVLGAC